MWRGVGMYQVNSNIFVFRCLSTRALSDAVAAARVRRRRPPAAVWSRRRRHLRRQVHCSQRVSVGARRRLQTSWVLRARPFAGRRQLRSPCCCPRDARCSQSAAGSSEQMNVATTTARRRRLQPGLGLRRGRLGRRWSLSWCGCSASRHWEQHHRPWPWNSGWGEI